jgi:hypothetical protein
VKHLFLVVISLFQVNSFAQNKGDLYLSYQHEFGRLNTLKTQSFQLQAKWFISNDISFNYYIGLRQFNDQKLTFHISTGPLVGVSAAATGLGLFIGGLSISAIYKKNKGEQHDVSAYDQPSDGYCENEDVNSIHFDAEDPDCYNCSQEGVRSGHRIAGTGLGLMALGVLVTFIPEEIEYHFALTERLMISPYISFGGVDCLKESNKIKVNWNWGAGTRLYLMNLKLGFNLSIHGAYKGILDYGSGWNYGLGAGYRFN